MVSKPDTSAPPSQETLRKLFDYDATLGGLRWRKAPSNRASTSTLAGCIKADGRTRVVRISGKLYSHPRLVYQWHHGDLAEGDVVVHEVHGEPHNDRINNLTKEGGRRDASRVHKAVRNGKLLGITWCANKQAYQAAIQDPHTGKTRFLGLYRNGYNGTNAYHDAKRIIEAKGQLNDTDTRAVRRLHVMADRQSHYLTEAL